LEHPAVQTLGKNASLANVKLAGRENTESVLNIIRCDRGGEVTAHMPGQCVVYFILDLGGRGLGPKDFVACLERGVIEYLSEIGVAATTDLKYPGVWVNQKKICAIGIRVKNRISMHGIALNVNNDLSLFEKIIPCGIADRGVVNLVQLIGRHLSSEVVCPPLAESITKQLGISELRIGYEKEFSILLSSLSTDGGRIDSSK
jgi:lipoate-protein ligase B